MLPLVVLDDCAKSLTAPITLLTVLGGYLLYRHRHASDAGKTHHFKTLVWSRWFEPVHFPTFQIRWDASPFGIRRDASWEKTSAQIELSSEAAEEILKKNETSVVVRREANPLVRWDTNVLPSNDMCEDEVAVDLLSSASLERLRAPVSKPSFWQTWAKIRGAITPSPRNDDPVPSSVPLDGDGSSDLLFVSVFDGHASGGVSALLKRVMHASLAWALSGVSPAGSTSAWSTSSVTENVTNVFKALDDDILNAPLNLVNGTIPHAKDREDDILPTPAPSLMALAEIANAGACALTAMLDTSQGLLYVANAGDCRAVAGWYDPSSGKWRCDTLTEDHEASNPDEGIRMRAKHPKEEADNIIIDEGHTPRVLAHCQCTRTLGDTSSKIHQEKYDSLCETLQIKPCSTRRQVKGTDIVPHPTPPYIENEPDVAVRSVRPASKDGEQLRFVILATDGLWDMISSEEAVLLAAAHIKHPHAPRISKRSLPLDFPLASASGDRPHPVEPLPGTVPDNSAGHWTFQDDNAATHLIRNAIPGNGDESVRRKALSMKGPAARVVRDDISVVMID